MLAVLYDVEPNTINYHIKKIFEDSESDGKSYDTKHYNLQMIIAVGFKLNSERAVQFRKWVNNIAKEYTIKGFAMDDERTDYTRVTLINLLKMRGVCKC